MGSASVRRSVSYGVKNAHGTGFYVGTALSNRSLIGVPWGRVP